MQTMVPLYGFGGVPYSAVRKAAPRNLLDNSDFRNPVNQRGQTSYSSQGWGYCIDRWMTFSSTATITESGLEISGSSRNIIGQRFSLDYLKKNPKDYTFVYCDANDVVHFSDHKYKYDNFLEFWIECGETTVIKWAALYEGEYTAETLPEYHPKGYGAELAECQRYYIKFNTSAGTANIGYGFAPNTNEAYIGISLPIVMRSVPSVIFDGGLYDRTSLKSVSYSGVSVNSVQANIVMIKLTATVTAGNNFGVTMNTSQHLELIADL